MASDKAEPSGNKNDSSVNETNESDSFEDSLDSARESSGDSSVGRDDNDSESGTREDRDSGIGAELTGESSFSGVGIVDSLPNEDEPEVVQTVYSPGRDDVDVIQAQGIEDDFAPTPLGSPFELDVTEDIQPTDRIIAAEIEDIREAPRELDVIEPGWGRMRSASERIGTELMSPEFGLALEDGANFGIVSQTVETDFGLRAAKNVSAGYTQTSTLDVLSDGSAVVHYEQDGDLYIGHGVERNAPGTSTMTELSGERGVLGNISTIQAEAVYSTGAFGAYSQRLAFEDAAEAGDFFTDAREFGFSQSLNMSPAEDISGFTLGAGWRGQGRAYAGMSSIGAYGQASTNFSLGLQYSQDDPNASVRLDSFEGEQFGAPGAIGLTYGRTSDYFVSHSPLLGAAELDYGFSEGSLSVAATTDAYGAFFGDITSTSFTFGGSVPTDGLYSDTFRDLRVRSLVDPTRDSQLIGMGFRFTDDLPIQRTGYRAEIRGLLGFEDSELVEGLVGAERSKLSETPAPERIEQIVERFPEHADLFSSEWQAEAFARVNEIALEQGYDPITEENWGEFLTDHFERMGPFYDYTEPMSDLTDRANLDLLTPIEGWQRTYISRDRVAAYDTAWEQITEESIEARRVELQAMDAASIYTEYREIGQRQPGVYFSVAQGQELVSSGLFHANLAGEANRVGFRTQTGQTGAFGINGFYSVNATERTRTTAIVGRIGVTQEALGQFEQVIGDPIAGPAIAALLNNAAYPRYQAGVHPETGETVFTRVGGGELISPSPPSQLMYDGFTPTDMIYGLTDGIGYTRDYSQIPGVYTLSEGDVSPTALAEHAIEQLQTAGVFDPSLTLNEEQTRTYAAAIIDTNFPGLPAEQIEDLLFPGANIALPSPYRSLDPIFGEVFPSEWNTEARVAYEEIQEHIAMVRGQSYTPLTDSEWDDVVHLSFGTQQARADALERGISESEWAMHMGGMLGVYDPEYQWRQEFFSEDLLEAYSPWLQ